MILSKRKYFFVFLRYYYSTIIIIFEHIHMEFKYSFCPGWTETIQTMAVIVMIYCNSMQ